MDSVVFHVGFPKTGSSALQVFLAQNRDRLLAKGVDYFNIGEFARGAAGAITSGNGALVARCLLPDGHPAKIANGDDHYKVFLEAIRASPATLGIVSSELFVEADKKLLSILLDRLRSAGVEARIAYFVREQSQILSSMYMQEVKRHGCTEDVDAFVERTYRHVYFLKYHQYYEDLVLHFGANNILVSLYEGAVKSGGLFRTFLELLGIDAQGLEFAVADVNTSLSLKELEIMLRLNRLKPRMQFSDFVVENSVKFGLTRAGGIHNILGESRTREIHEYFAVENRLFSERALNGREIFISPASPGQSQNVSAGPLTDQDLVLFFGGLLVQYDKRLAAVEARLTQAEHGLAKGIFK